MQNIYIGEFIRQRRKELNLSQEDLAYGICEVSTLSRIENGRCTPSRSKINALLQRLGLPEERYYAIVSKNEKEIEALKKEVVACNVMHQPQKGYELLEQLEKLCESDDFLTKQFILRSRILLGDLDGSISDYTKQVELLLQAIKITVPDFSIDRINDFLYTFDEIKIINQLASTYSDMNELDVALQIFAQLIKYIEKHFHEVLTGNGVLPMVLYNYARTLNLSKQHNKSIEISEQGRRTCVDYGHYQFLPGFRAIAAEDYYFLGDSGKSKEYYLEAYYLYKILDNERAVNEICAEVKKHFDFDLML